MKILKENNTLINYLYAIQFQFLSYVKYIDISKLCTLFIKIKYKMNLVESKTTVYYSNYSNGDIQIVLFGIQSCSKTEYIGIQYSIISQKPNIFGIWSILTIRENTALSNKHYRFN